MGKFTSSLSWVILDLENCASWDENNVKLKEDNGIGGASATCMPDQTPT